MAGYCTAADLRPLGGLPDGALSNPARLVSADATTNAFTLDVHGFALNDELTFRTDGGALPSPLVAATTYFAKPVTEYSFQVAATAGGAAIDITTAGSLVVVMRDLPIEGAITRAARVIDQSLPAHLVPLSEPYPEIVQITNAELAVGFLMNGSESKSLAAMVAEASKRIATWAKGVPLRAGDETPAPAANVAVSSAALRAPTDWSRFGGIS